MPKIKPDFLTAIKNRDDAIKTLLDNCVNHFDAAQIKPKTKGHHPAFYESPKSLKAFSDAINNLRQAHSEYEAEAELFGPGA